jgi:CRISPR/Cas system-associated protein Cas7 (RAMP superfamily)
MIYDRQKIQSLLTVISATLSAVREHPVFEQAVECDSYYTMNDLTIGDAIQALNEIVDGMEYTNSSDIEVLEEISEGHLEECLKALSEFLSC